MKIVLGWGQPSAVPAAQHLQTHNAPCSACRTRNTVLARWASNVADPEVRIDLTAADIGGRRASAALVGADIGMDQPMLLSTKRTRDEAGRE